MIPHAFRPLLLLMVVCTLAPPAWGQLYRWTDERGAVNFTEGLESVPERFRSSAVMVGHPELPRRPPSETPAPSGTLADPNVLARISFVPGAPIMVTARVNGGRSVRLLLDTGASKTVISPQALTALGVDTRRSRPATIFGVTGTAEAAYVMLESLEVGGARVGPLEVLAHNANMFQGEGLLGRDFLERFSVRIDTQMRAVVITRR